MASQLQPRPAKHELPEGVAAAAAPVLPTVLKLLGKRIQCWVGAGHRRELGVGTWF